MSVKRAHHVQGVVARWIFNAGLPRGNGVLVPARLPDGQPVAQLRADIGDCIGKGSRGGIRIGARMVHLVRAIEGAEVGLQIRVDRIPRRVIRPRNPCRADVIRHREAGCVEGGGDRKQLATKSKTDSGASSIDELAEASREVGELRRHDQAAARRL